MEVIRTYRNFDNFTLYKFSVHKMKVSAPYFVYNTK